MALWAAHASRRTRLGVSACIASMRWLRCAIGNCKGNGLTGMGVPGESLFESSLRLASSECSQ